MMSQPRKQAIPIHILSYISRCKENQTLKVGQLIEYNMRRIFLENLYPECGKETSTKPVSKKSKLRIYLDR